MVDLGSSFNFCREQFIPGVGGVTVWHGMKFDQEERPYIDDSSVMVLDGWEPPMDGRVYFDQPADSQAALVVFRDHEQAIMGSFVRFAAHPDIVGACIEDWDRTERKYHFDWPGYVRNTVESSLGGICVCVCGPCGNLSTTKRPLAGYQAGDREAKRIGTGVAEHLLSEWKTNDPDWKDLALTRTAHAAVGLPMRETFPCTMKEVEVAPEKAEALKKEYQAAIDSGERPDKVRQLINEYQHWLWVPHMVEAWIGITEDELVRHELDVELEAVVLNDLIIAGFPGETMSETSMWLCRQLPGRAVITVDLVNGYCSYQTIEEQFKVGGYSYACSCLSPDAVPKTRSAMFALVDPANGKE